MHVIRSNRDDEVVVTRRTKREAERELNRLMDEQNVGKAHPGYRLDDPPIDTSHDRGPLRKELERVKAELDGKRPMPEGEDKKLRRQALEQDVERLTAALE